MYYFAPDKLEAYGDANYLKGGIVYADAVTTVSDTYAEEIKTPFYGERLDGLMRARSNCLRGIVNGIDYNEYNPETDKLIEYNYNSRNFRKEKIKNKRALQRELGLEQNDSTFMIGIVSRLTDQKGRSLRLVPVKKNTKICSATLHGSIRARYPRTFIIPRRCPTRSMQPVMHS